MIDKTFPLISRIAGESLCSLAISRVFSDAVSSIDPLDIDACGGRRPIIAWLITDLPEPDSPTRATVEPFGTLKEAFLTARTRPSGKSKPTSKLLTDRM